MTDQNFAELFFFCVYVCLKELDVCYHCEYWRVCVCACVQLSQNGVLHDTCSFFSPLFWRGCKCMLGSKHCVGVHMQA